MATTYNHKAVEKKWREKLGSSTQSMSMMAKNRNITAWICSRIRQEAVFMSVTGEVM